MPTVFDSYFPPLANYQVDDCQDQHGGHEDRGLADAAHARPSRLSPRLPQRASLARALVVPTEVLFVDHPPTALDDAESAWWRDQLVALHDRGLTVVVGTKDRAPWAGLPARSGRIRDTQFHIEE